MNKKTLPKKQKTSIKKVQDDFMDEISQLIPEEYRFV